MLKRFWNLAYTGLELVETKQDSGAKVDELDDTGHNANDGEGFCHSVFAVVDKSARDKDLSKRKGTLWRNTRIVKL